VLLQTEIDLAKESQEMLYLAPHLKSLPIPEDYRFSQLHRMLTPFITWCISKPQIANQ
jgi:hypothetical protein